MLAAVPYLRPSSPVRSTSQPGPLSGAAESQAGEATPDGIKSQFDQPGSQVLSSYCSDIQEDDVADHPMRCGCVQNLYAQRGAGPESAHVPSCKNKWNSGLQRILPGRNAPFYAR